MRLGARCILRDHERRRRAFRAVRFLGVCFVECEPAKTVVRFRSALLRRIDEQRVLRGQAGLCGAFRDRRCWRRREDALARSTARLRALDWLLQ
jgi:hypothetical protein